MLLVQVLKEMILNLISGLALLKEMCIGHHSCIMRHVLTLKICVEDDSQ